MEITDVNTLFGAYPSLHPESTADSLAAVMERNGVDWGLTLSTWGLFHHSTEGNTETLRACKMHDHLIPVATANPQGYWGQREAIEEIARPEYEMFRFFPYLQGWPIDFAPFQALLATLTSTSRKPIMVSVYNPGDITALERIVTAYQNPIILEGVSSAILSEAVTVMQRNAHIYLETHNLRVADSLALLRDTVGIQRVLFGSDAPGLSLAASLRFIKKSGLSDSDLDAVLGGNANTIWHGSEA
jgi:predicted TIM-barrel fold metal-dependent hydrolase